MLAETLPHAVLDLADERLVAGAPGPTSLAALSAAEAVSDEAVGVLTASLLSVRTRNFYRQRRLVLWLSGGL